MAMSKRKIRRILQGMKCFKLPYCSVPKDYDVTKNININYCTQCGGECCKRCGCECSPDDFDDLSFDGLRREIEKGYISIECIKGDVIEKINDSLILRIRNKNSPIVDYVTRKTECILHTKDGCKLSYEERPSGGKLLIPSNRKEGIFFKRRCCHSSYSIEACCYEWSPHQSVLLNLAWYFIDKDFPCSI